MKKTVIMNPPLQAAPRPPDIETKKVTTGVGYHVNAAFWSGLLVALGLGALSALVAYLMPDLAHYLPAFLAISLTAGALVSAIKGARWIDEVITRDWRLQDLQLERDWRLDEDDEEEILPDEESGASLTPDRISLAGFQILDLHFRAGLACTRPEMEARGIRQAEWNAVNQALVGLEIKSARGWIETDYALALERWLNNIQIGPDLTALIRSDPRSSSWRRIKLA